MILKTDKLSKQSSPRDGAYRIWVSMDLCFAREFFQHGEWVSHLSRPELNCGVALRTVRANMGKSDSQEALTKMYR